MSSNEHNEGESCASKVTSLDSESVVADHSSTSSTMLKSEGSKIQEEKEILEDQTSPGKKKKHKKKKSKDNTSLSESCEVLLPGKIVGSEDIGFVEVKGQRGPACPCVDVKEHEFGTRPKSAKKPKNKDGRCHQKSKKDCQVLSDQTENERKQGYNKGQIQQQFQTDGVRPKAYRQDSLPKGGNRPDSGPPYRNEGQYRGNNRPDSGSPYRDIKQSSGNRPGSGSNYQKGERNEQNQYGQGRQTPQKGQKQDGKYQQRQNRRGERTPNDNQRSGNKGKGMNTPRNKQPNFEPYWPQEELQRGLKLGNLIQGPIRINPKNYEEAYIPHPDGVSDIFICGIKDRNRALNGDIVAVLLNDRDNWKIHMNNLKDLEEKHQDSESVEVNSQANTDMATEVIPDSKENDTDSEPDVIIESEEIIDLTDGNSINQSEISKDEYFCIDQPSDSLSVSSDQGNINQSETSKTASSSDFDKSKVPENVEDISEKLENISIDSKQLNSARKDTKGKNDKKRMNEDNKAKNSPSSVQKKYSTLQEVLKDGSDIAKNLFTTIDEEKANSANRILQRTGRVVAILAPKHSRACTGHIHLMQDKNPDRALFKPIDYRVPRIIIPMENCPKDFLQRPEDHVNTLFICRIKEWKENSMYAHGELMRSLGEAGEIEPETEGILIENDVDNSDFTEKELSSLPVQNLPWQIPEEEIGKRRDFRQQCVFTIDPATARDLDDALSCEKLEDGTYDVGVHIADVSYFLEEDTALDKKARFRATSVYLVQKVIPMLPRILCEELCSLNPNQDRLTFSVVWNMSETGEIYGEWFGRSVIRSCVKLSYDHAQGFIEEPEREWTEEELPEISDNYPISQIRDTVLNLQKIAKNLRKARFDEGALRLDQVKLQFTLDKETGMPNGYNIYQQKDSNRLVEEFMLLANMAVAHKIKNHFPEKAFLRRHPPPQSKMVDDLVELCNNLGFPIDPSSAGTLQRSLWRYAGNDELSVARMQVLVSMCSKPMQNAKYFCSGCIDDEELYRHYALNVPLYTHFTSPIRRYADVMVHRTLAAALEYCPPPDRSMVMIQGIAENCNDRKTNSKRASELSSELYFAVFVKTAGPFEEKAMVMGVLDKAFDVFIMKFGVTKRVYCDKLAIKDKLYIKEQKNPVLTLYWEPTQENGQGTVQKISIFTIVTCILKPGELPLQWMAIVKPPNE